MLNKMLQQMKRKNKRNYHKKNMINICLLLNCFFLKEKGFDDDNKNKKNSFINVIFR